MIRRKAGADVSHIPLINSTNGSFCRLLSTAARTSPTSKLHGLATSNAAERSSEPFASLQARKLLVLRKCVCPCGPMRSTAAGLAASARRLRDSKPQPARRAVASHPRGCRRSGEVLDEDPDPPSEDAGRRVSVPDRPSTESMKTSASSLSPRTACVYFRRIRSRF